jgi:hypothetical protein
VEEVGGRGRRRRRRRRGRVATPRRGATPWRGVILLYFT